MPNATDTQTATHAVADDQASRAALAAGVRIRPAQTPEELRQASTLIDLVWSPEGTPTIMPYAVLRAQSHAGNYNALAERDGEVIGVLTAFLGMHDTEPVLHSHIAAAAPGVRGGGIGRALKLHQRAWAIGKGLGLVTWTFDPLIRRNAWFNLGKLGATGEHYLPDFYGQMGDAINGADATDRLLAQWDLTSDKVGRAADTGRVEQDMAALETAGSHGLLLDTKDDQPVQRPGEGNVLGVRVPADYEAIRRSDPDLAAQWRAAVREQLGGALHDGFRAEAVSVDGLYVLHRRN